MFKRIQNNRYTQDGRGWTQGTEYKWRNAEGNESVTVGEFFVFRLNLDVPKGAYIPSAKFEVEYAHKNGNTVPQYFDWDAWMEPNSAPYPTTSEVLIGPTGSFPPSPRQRTKAGTSGNVFYGTATPDDPDRTEFDVGVCVQEIVNRPDYYQGMPVAVIIKPTSELGDLSIRMRDNASASPAPNLQVEYFEDFWNTDRTKVNILDNQTGEVDLESWVLSTSFGYYGDGMTLQHSTEQARTGTKSVKVIGGDLEPTKPFGVQALVTPAPNTSYVFAGWIYVPSSNPNPVGAHFQYLTSVTQQITVKDQWVPFCTPPLRVGEVTNLWPSITSLGASSSSLHFYVDDVMVIESRHAVMPWTGDTVDTQLVQHEWNETDKRGASIQHATTVTSAMRETPTLLENGESLTGWSSTAALSVVSGAVRATIPVQTPGQTHTVTLTKNMTRKHRFIGVDISSAEVSIYAPVLTSVTTTEGTVTKGLTGYKVSGITYYDIPIELGNTITSMTWSMLGRTGYSSYLDISSIYDSDWMDLVSGFRPRSRWVMNRHGLWQRGEPVRTSGNADDFVGLGDTVGNLESSGKTWNQLENATLY